MRNCIKAIALFLAVTLCLACPVGASAAELGVSSSVTIDPDAKGSLTLFKYDLSGAERDGVWDSSYVSTGVYDQNVNDALGGSGKENHLGNGDTSYAYAVKGVGFTYCRVADIVQYSGEEGHLEVLYGVDKTGGAPFLKALGLSDGKERFEEADKLDEGKYFYQADNLIKALDTVLAANSTTVKNAMEVFAAQDGTAMPLTDGYGKTQAKDLSTGLYLLVESSVPEQVVSTCNPALISIPMTANNGTNATDGGSRWIYDVTVYPKNLTGYPSLEKTLRESKNDTGKHEGSTDNITDGYAHTGTASDGDIIDYQIVSTLPSITSAGTYLSEYSFVDTLSKGLSYCKQDVALEFFTDEACTQAITTWKEGDGKFSVEYATTDKGESTMSIRMTEAGLAEINTSKAVYPGETMINSGFSGCTVRIIYKAQMHADDSVVYGDGGNPNSVVLLWKRTSQDHYDTLVDDAHLYTYGLELTKLFSDENGDPSKVEFLIRNKTDGYYVKAKLDSASGIYYVEGHTDKKEEATRFVPVTSGKVTIKGLEDDEYRITETKTDNGYTLLRVDISVVISTAETAEKCGIYTTDALGLIQNDPRFAAKVKDADQLKNATQKHLEHSLLTASAQVDKNKVNMLEDKGSPNAEAPMRVVNTKGFDLPKTGDRGVWMYGVVGVLLMAGSVASIFLTARKKRARK